VYLAVVLITVHRPGPVHKATEQAVILVAKDLGLSPASATQLTIALNSFRPDGPPPDGLFSASLRKSRRLCWRYTI